jgi:D-Tyr-tRNAtyr deacylase
VTVVGEPVGEIGAGLLARIGVSQSDRRGLSFERMTSK